MGKLSDEDREVFRQMARDALAKAVRTCVKVGMIDRDITAAANAAAAEAVKPVRKRSAKKAAPVVEAVRQA